ncbi:MAG: hypothetical protein GY834_10915, partial [Bacteroidetes bacterium]|nr:hypothetical protein [Bacteroidota bacterium]
DGDWGVIIGAALEGAWQAQKHIIPPFSPPSNWFCDRSLDWGSSHPFAINYYCVSNGEQLPDGRIYPTGAVILFHELYGVKTKDNGAPDPNVGVRWSAEQISNEMKLIESAYYSKSGCVVQPGPADLDIFTKQDNHCIYDNFYKNGIDWTKAQKGPGSRATGLHLLIELLSQEPPLFYVTSNCLNWLRTVPSLVRDKNNWEVVEKKGEDHAYDSTRYRLLANAPFVPNQNRRFWK